MKIREIYWKP